jgi:predicted molibdopterin-dependent oxidoreductase YjgC
MNLHVSGGQIFRVSGRFDNQVNFGNLCVKGRFGTDFVHSPDRLVTPMMRLNRDQPLQAVDWEQALDHVGTRLKAIRDTSGPDSIVFLASAKCTNEENYLIQKLARAVVGTHNVDHCARL